MSNMLDHALRLAAQGFHVFPLGTGSKLPMITDYPTQASRDPDQIKSWWLDPVMELPQPYNVGISTTKFGDGESLLAIDIDNKGDKRGSDVVSQLEKEGKTFPKTYRQKTPTGGRHLVYRTREPVGQGVDVLGRGVDTRGSGGYIVAAGSLVPAGAYTGDYQPVAEAPEWILKACKPAPKKKPKTKTTPKIDEERAAKLVIAYLENEAPLSIEGEGGDQTAYVVAARVKDFGVSKEIALELMMDHWNSRCTPEWDPSELEVKVNHAYTYGQEPVGVSNPQVQFTPVEDDAPKDASPILELNKDHAFVLAGGGHHILWETKDASGRFYLDHLSEVTFHKKHASETINYGNKTRPLTEAWMTSPLRRSYDGICFNPGRPAPPRFYNLWRGFSVEPPKPGEKFTPLAKRSLDMFLEHARKNVCRDDKALCDWLIGYFAHLIQKPWEKPLVAPVFRGRKGVGKNALVERVGSLLGPHFLITANRRFLIGNFNGHLENCLFLALDEAFWSGDKQAEGTLKDLITGKSHNIERKGKESYTVQNCTRVCIIGNEDWLTPASHDERRFAVFDVGDGRKQDRSFFAQMREGMEEGGYKLLLKYLMDFDLSKVDVNDAPKTSALLDQKVHSLDPFHQWWLECLVDKRIVNMDFQGDDWLTEIPKDLFRQAFRKYLKDRQIRGRVPDDRVIGKLFRNVVPLVVTQKRRELGDSKNVYVVPTIDECRREWSKFIGHDVDWSKE